jgi:hypothetical protein
MKTSLIVMPLVVDGTHLLPVNVLIVLELLVQLLGLNAVLTCFFVRNLPLTVTNALQTLLFSAWNMKPKQHAIPLVVDGTHLVLIAVTIMMPMTDVMLLKLVCSSVRHLILLALLILLMPAKIIPLWMTV